MDERFEYYWENGRVVEYINHRAGRRGRWPHSVHDPGNLIVAIRRVRQTNHVDFGPQRTSERVRDALLRYSRYDCDPMEMDIGPGVPEELLRAVANQARSVAENVTRQWEACGNEEGQTGFFSGLMNTSSSFRYGEWEATIRVQAFSPQTKEPLVGADVGVIVDLHRAAQRIVKGALVQAKRTRQPPPNPMRLPDLHDQVFTMRQTTRESYGMIYSDYGTYMFHPDEPQEQIGMDRFFSDMIVCRRGDRSEEAVAQAYDRSVVIDITVATGTQ
jgi:hypothetical protein